MEGVKNVRRLYIGGLSYTISQKDIKDRFGKFGEVSDVEIVTRQDLTGAPLKTFGYININISDAGLKKCMTVLNKSRWKGGTLQIEVAKESFLHRLAIERQQAAAKTQTSKVDLKETLMDSFKKAGVENFHMKSAVPGTEIPGHKDWVVSKFGRVLPVLHLKNQIKKKVFKYDPSKHCHNIKRLETEMTTATPVSKLTWEILDADNEISKKRRGEFPPQKAPSAKIRKNSVNRITMESYLGTVRDHQQKEEDQRRSLNGVSEVQVLRDFPENRGSSAAKKQNPLPKNQYHHLHVWDSDVDSEEEIKMLVASENARSLEMSLGNEVDLEVVGDDFVLTPNNLQAQGSKRSGQLDDEQDYDSADTDEILSNCRSFGEQKVATETINGPQPKMQKNSDKIPTRGKGKTGTELITGDFSHSGKSSSDEEDSSGNEDSDYEAMMANCYRLELSLADLENLAKGPSASSEEDCQRPVSHKEPNQSSEVVLPQKTKPLAAKTGNTPDAILAAILADDSSDETCNRMKQNKKRKTSSMSLPVFMGTKSLFGLMNGAQPDLNVKRKKQGDFIMMESDSKPTMDSSSDSISSANQNSDIETLTNQPKAKAIHSKPLLFKGDMTKRRENGKSEDSSSSEDDKTEQLPKNRQSKLKVKTNNASNNGSQPGLSDNHDSASSDSKGNHGQIKDVVLPKVPESFSEKSEPHNKPPQGPGITRTSEKQQEDNQKRLAALEQKQKATEQQKKLIQSALSKLDTPGTSKGKHVVFHSDDESEEEAQAATETPTKTLFDDSPQLSEDNASEVEPDKTRQSSNDLTVKKFLKQGGSKLFLSSEDEDDEEEDDQRFQIKPQFEGKAGQKLMGLQSRFGTDMRFRMDSRFLESDEEANAADPKPCSGLEGELREEKKKNLNILQSVLHISLQASETSQESVKSKTFRDVSALHYDPTKEEHAAFETKPEEPKKESKATRRKKREAAEKLPEVSKDIFYNVAMDLKEVFGPTKDIADGKEAVAWDKEDEEMMKELDNKAGDTAAETESSGFKFSFFGDDPVEDTTVKDDYKVELLKGAKVSWQADPRFQDSSSEEEEDEEEEPENLPHSASFNEGPVQPKKSFFFFFEDDERLKEGPKMFCRMGKLEDQRERWEDTRSLLIEEYRKKHKNAKRRVKTSWKS